MLPVEAPLEPMLCRSEPEVPDADGWLYEPKWDGFRALVFRDGDRLEVASRNALPLLRYFPELEEPLRRALPERCVVDGEIVIAGEKGLEFDALQLRLHPAESRVRKLAAEMPATVVLFDLLALGDEDLRGEPTSGRRRRLLDAVTLNSQVAITPQTGDPEEARDWFTRYEGAGCDGVVAKRAGDRYKPGVRDWVKVKHLRTVDCVVGGFRLEKGDDAKIGSLLLGLYDDDGVLHHVGHTSGFAAKERREIREQLRPLEGGTSFGAGRTPGAPSRWSKGREAEWVAVRPELVCEVAFDHLQGGRFRHASRFLRWRPDREPRSCGYDQLEPPNPFDLRQIVQIGD